MRNEVFTRAQEDCRAEFSLLPSFHSVLISKCFLIHCYWFCEDFFLQYRKDVKPNLSLSHYIAQERFTEG